jgi:hypothetical protein
MNVIILSLSESKPQPEKIPWQQQRVGYTSSLATNDLKIGGRKKLGDNVVTFDLIAVTIPTKHARN